MAKVNVEKLTEAQETLLIPLWARAVEAEHPRPILLDTRAVELVEAIDYDFERFVRKKVNPVGFCARAVLFDRVAREFLQRHPSAAVVEIGAGLDTRFDRLDNGTVRWFDLDLPAAMQVRRLFFQETPRRTFLATSVLEPGWIAAVKAAGPEAVLLIAEGVFYFFTTEQLVGLFSMLADHFPGASILFDSESPLYVWYANLRHPLRDSRVRWSLRDVKQIERWDGRLKVERSIGFGDPPYYDQTLGRYPLAYRLARWLCPAVRNLFRVSLVRLG